MSKTVDISTAQAKRQCATLGRVRVSGTGFTMSQTEVDLLRADVRQIRADQDKLGEKVETALIAQGRAEVKQDQIGASVEKMNSTMVWLVRAIFAAFLVAGATFVIQGGLVADKAAPSQTASN